MKLGPRRKALIILLLTCAGLCGYISYKNGFCEEKITHESWPVTRKSLSYSEAEKVRIQEIVDQAFHYLGEGRQCYAFVSDDGCFVLKFIKSANAASIKRLTRSINVAAKQLAKQTAILYVHLEPKNGLQKEVTVIDRLGKAHHIALDKVPFLIQKRARKAMPTLQALLQEGKLDELTLRLDQLITLIIERARLGVIHPDGRLLDKHNVGFLEDRAVYIDVGTFRKSKKSRTTKRLAKEFLQLQPIVDMLQKHDPELAVSFTIRIEKAIREISSTPASLD